MERSKAFANELKEDGKRGRGRPPKIQDVKDKNESLKANKFSNSTMGKAMRSSISGTKVKSKSRSVRALKVVGSTKNESAEHTSAVQSRRRGRPLKSITTYTIEHSTSTKRKSQPLTSKKPKDQSNIENRRNPKKKDSYAARKLNDTCKVVLQNIDKLLTDKDNEKKLKGKKRAIKNVLTAIPAEEESELISPAKKIKTEPASSNRGKNVRENITKKKKVKEEKADCKENLVLPKKGITAVDPLFAQSRCYHVYTEGDEVWDCMLNQTNIQFNNNKFYLIQLLEDNTRPLFSLWMRWGRVGNKGQSCLRPYGVDLEKAKQGFKEKFYAKTKNEWDERHSFEKVPGKYDLLHMDNSIEEEDTVDGIEKELPKKKKAESKLDEKIYALTELVCNIQLMEQAAAELKYDTNRTPLGKLTSAQISAGYAALQEIDTIIRRSDSKKHKDLVEACNKFYTRIPHYFGMKVLPIIRTTIEIKTKISLLQSLDNIREAMNIMSVPQEPGIHPVDQCYSGLECDISVLDKCTSEYKILENYLVSTHGETHTWYTMNVLEIFKVDKSVENERFKDVGNRMLLWHGSRLSNWAGILSQGLRIAPPEAPSTGYMFGKGIYFADMASKSANYCLPSATKDVGLLVLCEVALGNPKPLYESNYNAPTELSDDFHSVQGYGIHFPQEKNFVTMSDGVLVPMGPPSRRVIDNTSGVYTLHYNEYVVYNAAQVRMKYLLKVKFNFCLS